MGEMIRATKYAAAVLMILVLAGCDIAGKKQETLEQKYARVQEEISGFNEKVKQVQDENTALREKISGLEKQVFRLTSENEIIKRRYQSLIKQRQAAKVKKAE